MAARDRGSVLSLVAAGALFGCIAPVDLGGGTSPPTATPVASALPPVAGTLTGVAVTVNGDSVGIDFDPVDDAVDYRVYPLPPDADVTLDGKGGALIRDAIYRCAGARQTFDLKNNLNAGDPDLLLTRREFSWTATIPDEPTLGYVYVAPGPGRVPVYAVAGKPSNDEAGWRESRTKIYTTDAAERARLLTENGRDDGIVFYVPSAAAPGTRSVYRSLTRTDLGGGASAERQNYFDENGLAAHGGDSVPPAAAFEVLRARPLGAITQPLMVVGYENSGHDELAVGEERFARAAHQGKGPLWHLEWSGLKAPTTLVVEALDSGCPYQGFLAAQHLDAPPHQTFSTLGDLRNAAPAGEVFVNGQFDVTTRPKALARALVAVAPATPPDWDWYEGFGGTASTTNGRELPLTACFHCLRVQTPRFEINVVNADVVNDALVLSYGAVLGQLWLGYDDNAGGTLARAQFTALEKARIDADPARFLHVGFSATAASTQRRYPQLIISDQDAPLDVGLRNPDNDTVIFAPRGGPEVSLQVAAIHGLVNGNPWAVDLPGAPIHAINGTGAPQTPQALEPPFEHVGIDRMTQFDVYLSATRLYVFMDGVPGGCTLLPPEVTLPGPVTVTFGDVFFDEAAEEDVCIATRPYDFLHRHGCRETSRHLDELGFRSAAPLPPWDEARVPCAPFTPDG